MSPPDASMDRPPTPREFLAHLRHELRTPVNAIIGYSEMLIEDAEEPLPASWSEGLAMVRVLGKQILSLINELLSGNRADSGEIKGILDQARAGLRGPASQVVATCSVLLTQAAGMPQETHSADLERVRSAGESLLAQLESAVPPECASVVAPEPIVLPGTNETETPLATGGCILVVDDDRSNRFLLGRALHRQGHEFAVASGGAQALEMIDSLAFDVVLLDVMMPGLSGIEVLRRLKSNPALRHIPVVMISALDELASVVRCLESGAEDYLPKPFDPILLRARVGACLEKKRLRDRELAYLRDVGALTSCAAALEAGTFTPEDLGAVSQRNDELGILARVFERMAREVKAREERLRQEVLQLRVEIDEARKATQVAEITQTDYFQELRRRAQQLRERRQ